MHRQTPRVYAIIDRSVFLSESDWLRAVEAIANLETPVRVAIQLCDRLGMLSPNAMRTARELTAEARHIPVLLEGSYLQTRALGFEGTHWLEADMPHTAPAIRLLRGASVHTPEGLAHAHQIGIDFVVFGPVFAPRAKSETALGVPALREFCDASHVPALAIGHIGLFDDEVLRNQVAAVLGAGAHGVALRSALGRHTSKPADVVLRTTNAIAVHDGIITKIAG